MPGPGIGQAVRQQHREAYGVREREDALAQDVDAQRRAVPVELVLELLVLPRLDEALDEDVKPLLAVPCERGEAQGREVLDGPRALLVDGAR